MPFDQEAGTPSWVCTPSDPGSSASSEPAMKRQFPGNHRPRAASAHHLRHRGRRTARARPKLQIPGRRQRRDRHRPLRPRRNHHLRPEPRTRRRGQGVPKDLRPGDLNFCPLRLSMIKNLFMTLDKIPGWLRFGGATPACFITWGTRQRCPSPHHASLPSSPPRTERALCRRRDPASG